MDKKTIEKRGSENVSSSHQKLLANWNGIVGTRGEDGNHSFGDGVLVGGKEFRVHSHKVSQKGKGFHLGGDKVGVALLIFDGMGGRFGVECFQDRLHQLWNVLFGFCVELEEDDNNDGAIS